VGDLVRDELENNQSAEMTIKMKEKYEKGQPVEDKYVFKLIATKLSQLSQDVVFDNFPFTKKQADFLNKIVEKNNWSKPIIINIKIDPETAVKRISSRRICSKCKTIYKENIELCSKCGTKLTIRSDDNEETVRKRINIYHPNILTILEAYSKDGKVINIDGEPSIEEVYREINQKL